MPIKNFDRSRSATIAFFKNILELDSIVFHINSSCRIDEKADGDGNDELDKL